MRSMLPIANGSWAETRQSDADLQCGGTHRCARRKESPHRGVSERRDEYCERAWMDVLELVLPSGLTECWFC